MKVAVIGGGVIGLCSAYYLMKSGHQVTVFESKPEGDYSGCSFINCGYLTPSHFIPLASPGALYKGFKWMFNSKSPLYIKPRFNAELARWLWLFGKSSSQKHIDASAELLLALNLKSKSLYEQLATELDFDYETKGLLVLNRTKKGLAEEAHVSQMGNDLGLDCRVLDRDEVHAFEPNMKPDVLGGVFFPEDAQIDPVKLMKSMTSALESGGVKILFDHPVQKIDAASSSLHSGGQSFSFDKLVLAAGSWSPQLASNLGVSIPMQAGKGYSMTVSNPSVNLQRPVVLAERKVALTPFQNSLRFGGTMEISGIHHEVNRNRVQAIQEASSEYLPPVNEQWFSNIKIEQGLRPVSPDGMPYIGTHPRNKNIIVATGHAMLGMSLGPITGELVTQLVDEQETSLPLVQLNPDRF